MDYVTFIYYNNIGSRDLLKAGSRATGTREPGQARKGAAISGTSCVPRGCPAIFNFRGIKNEKNIFYDFHYF
ncbi:hypothetical protein AS160_09785 [Marinitoga sp. 38H-ov]|nr:hypothetical protein AS160_09785 [Marinitoga sp. 38H-ov]